MKKINRFKREKLTSYLVMGVLILIFGLFIKKMEHVACKVRLVNQGITFYENKEWLEAEQTLQKAERYNWFEYKKEEVDTYSQDLMWITNYYSLLQDIKEGVSQVGDMESFETFRSLAQQYEGSGFEKLPDWQQMYLLEKCPVKEAVDGKWIQYKAMIIQLLEEAEDELKYSWAKKSAQDIPEKYFSSDKDSTLLKLIKTGDTKYFEEGRKGVGSYSELGSFLNRMNEIYRMNNECNYDSAWLSGPIKTYLQEVLELQAQGEVINFTHYVKVCREEAEGDFLPENMETFINNYVVGKEKTAEQLVTNKEYEAAIKLYTDLKYFKNYDKVIKVISKAQEYENDEGFLSKKADQYSVIQKGSSSFGATKYIVGVSAGGNALELVNIEGNAEDYTVTTYKINLNQREVSSVEVVNDMILVTGVGTTRAKHFDLVALQEEKLVMLLDLEAESLTLENGGMQLKVMSPQNREEGKNYIYAYTQNGYEEVGEEVNENPEEVPVDGNIEVPGVSDEAANGAQEGQNGSPGNIDFSGLMGQTIIIECYVLDEQTNNLALAICTSQGADGNDQSVYVYYGDGSAVSSGMHKVKGVYTHDASYVDGSGNEVLIPCIQIMEIDG